MSARVYLMADFGGKVPSLAARRGTGFATVEEWRAMIEVNNTRFSSSTRKTRRAPGFWSALERVAKCRAWWLVEAESADACRRIIHAASVIGGGRGRDFACNGMDLKDGRPPLTGRILAQGGQS